MPSLPPVQIRPVTGDDYDRITWALYSAVAWNPERRLPPFDVLMQHPEMIRHHEGWGRPGDMGVVAEMEGEFAGIAFCRRFTDEDHGHGYLNADTPEVAVAVVEGLRRRGIGTLLMNRLADAVRRDGIGALSLSVDAANPARQLYERLGYRRVSIDEGGVRMLLDDLGERDS